MIRASAGTGKTFQLSNRFIGLAARQAPDNILATTFTRKAAGEILDRVLVRLAEAALKPKKLAELAQHVDGPAIDRARCLGMLREMIRHLHRLRVSTLDSFFVQIAQSFSLELGLPPGWEIAEEIADQALRAEAIRTVLQNESTAGRRPPDAPADQGRGLALGERADRLAREGLVRHLHRGPGRGMEVAAPPEATRRQGIARRPLKHWRQVPLPEGKIYPKARAQDLASAKSEDWEAFLGKGLGAKILDGTEMFSSKPIPAEILAAYRPLVEHAKAVLLARIADQTEATRDLLERFDAAYQRLKASERSLRFEDVTRRLGEAAIADRLDEVVYRLDGQVAHLLLDEFQDTSALQWRVLRPFAQRVVRGGEDRSFFCVGDVKQAIYGWRGGVAEIFDALDDEFGGLPSQALNESFRSSPVVIDCVNKVFEGDRRQCGVAEVPGRGPEMVAAVHAAHHRPNGSARLLPPGHGPAGRRRRGARRGHAAVRCRRSCPAPRAGARAGHRRAGPPQQGRGPADLRVAIAGNRRQRGGRQPLDRFAGRAGHPLALDPGRPPGRHDRAVPRGHLAAGSARWN